MDLINRESLLQQCSDYCKANCKYTEVEQEVMCRACRTGDIIEFIEEASSQNQWIPCSERLPEEGKPVLITIKWQKGEPTVEKSIRGDYNFWGGFGRNIDVIAWQPLPEPYKESEEEYRWVVDLAPTVIKADKN